MSSHAGIRLYELQKQGIKTDVTFVCQETEVKCHGLVVSSFGFHLADLIEREGRVIPIDDVSPHTLRTILQFLYTGECEISPVNVFELIHASKKFNLTDLEKRCAQVGFKLSKENILTYAQEAMAFDAKQSLSKCKDFFKENAKAILAKEEFLDISTELLGTFCTIEGMACSVMELFAACMKWATKECKRQKLESSPENLQLVLACILDNIKFEEMPMEDFLEFVVPLQILTNEKVGQVVNDKQKDKKYEHWTEVVVVAVDVNVGSNYDDTTRVCLPLYTRIKDIKSMYIFNEGQTQCPADKFTVKTYPDVSSDNLADSATLASFKCYDPGYIYIYLQVIEIKCTAKDYKNRWEFEFTFDNRDYDQGYEDEIIKHRMSIESGVNPFVPNSVQITHPADILPGETFIVKSKDK